MTDKQYQALVVNLHLLSAHQHQIIGHLFGLVHGLKGIVVQIGVQNGMSEAELERHFADATRKMDYTLSEIPFPEWEMPDDDSSPPSNSQEKP